MDRNRLLATLLLVAAILVLAIVFLSRRNSEQDAYYNQPNLNQNITEPPSPAPAPAPVQTSDANPTATQSMLDGNWLLVKVTASGQAVDMDVPVSQPLTLNLKGTTKSFFGFAGCNSFSGGYASDSKGKFSFGAIASTKMYCQVSSPLENTILSAMAEVDQFSLSPNANLFFRSSDSKYQLEYMPAI